MAVTLSTDTFADGVNRTWLQAHGFIFQQQQLTQQLLVQQLLTGQPICLQQTHSRGVAQGIRGGARK